MNRVIELHVPNTYCNYPRTIDEPFDIIHIHKEVYDLLSHDFVRAILLKLVLSGGVTAEILEEFILKIKNYPNPMIYWET